MRLTTVILLATMLQVSASSFGQKITLKEKGVSLLKVFKSIESQTGYSVIYYDKKVNTANVVDVNFTNAPIEVVMKHILTGLPLTYTINKTNVIIKAEESSLVDKIIGFFAQIDVRGRIVDENGLPLAGATVKVKGTTKSVLSNSEGKFFLANVDENAVIEVSYVGYAVKEFKAGKDVGDVGLVSSDGALKEVEINAGYYKVSERNRTGSISSVKAATIAQQPVGNPLQALQNRVPGLQITQQTGLPGGGISVQIRGRSSINTAVGNNPLYIIDGVIYPSVGISTTTSSQIAGTLGTNPLSLINPADIASIDVLKDADATAIYGSRGANGVILITTKSGNIGAPRVNATISQGFSDVAHKLDLMNTPQYLQLRREALQNDGLTTSTTDYDINGTWDQNKYTDWQKIILGGTAEVTLATMNVSGGSENMNYLIGGNFSTQGTVFPGDFNYRTGGFHSSLNLGSTKSRLSANFTINYNHVKSNLMINEPTRFILLAPNAPNPYNENGNINWYNNTVYANPMAELLRVNSAGTDNIIANASFGYRIFNNVFLKNSFGFTSIKREEFSKVPLASVSPAFAPTTLDRVSNFSNAYNNSYITEPQITYKVKFNGGILDALLGSSFQANNSETRTITGTGFNSDAQMDNIAASAVLSTKQQVSSQYRYSAIFSRINYSLSDKYIVNLTARRDGSSRFGNGKQFANFGAIGSAWIFSDEKIIKDNFPFINFGKLRASYGITGNDQIPDYGYLQLWANGTGNNSSYQGIPVIIPNATRVGNPNFAWETNRKLEIALQLNFLNNTLNTEISWYRNRSSNQLIGDPLPLSTGNGTVTANRPASVQNTGLEIQTNINILSKTNLKWSTALNLTVPKNKLLKYPGIETSADLYNYIVGQPLSIKRIYNVKGINSTTGLYDIEDHDGNGIINDNDRYIQKFTGQFFYGGLSNNLQYKRFSLDFLIGFTKQNSLNNYLNGAYAPGAWDPTLPLSNQPTLVIQRWDNIGDNASIQKASTSSASSLAYNRARTFGGESIEDASFIRLKNLSLNYHLPKILLDRLNISDARVSLQGQNLITLTKYTGLDPESQSIAALPPLRTITLGLDLTF